MLQINEPIVVSNTTYINPNFKLVLQGDASSNTRTMTIVIEVLGDNMQHIRYDTVDLMGEEFNTFYTAWLSDKDIFSLLKQYGKLPQDLATPEGDLLNIVPEPIVEEQPEVVVEEPEVVVEDNTIEE